jgi:predicted nucleic acid-binding protein
MLLESNIIIYAAQPAHAFLRQFIADNAPAVSAVSYVEVLGYHKLTEPDRQTLEGFFAAATVLPITHDVLDRAVALRQAKKMTLGDALVAATALVHGRKLVTRNVKDFSWIAGLDLLDPFSP